MKRLLFYLLASSLLVSCGKNEYKANVTFRSIDLSVLVEWTGEKGSIKIDSLGHVFVKTEVNEANIYYFEYDLAPSALDSISNSLADIDFSKIDSTYNGDCNRCLIYIGYLFAYCRLLSDTTNITCIISIP